MSDPSATLAPDVTAATSLPIDYDKRLMLFSGRANPELAAKIAGRLPVKWTAQGVVMGSDRFSAETHAPILIYPNPLNPKKYVVLNSGFTFREFDYLNNARQIPKLPDYAVVDTATPPDDRWPGKIVLAGFFDESCTLLGLGEFSGHDCCPLSDNICRSARRGLFLRGGELSQG